MPQLTRSVSSFLAFYNVFMSCLMTKKRMLNDKFYLWDTLGMQCKTVPSTTWGNRHTGLNSTQYHVWEQACRAQSYSVPRWGTGMQGTVVLSTTWGNRQAGHNCTQYHVGEQECRHNRTQYHVGEQACRSQSYLVSRGRTDKQGTIVLSTTWGTGMLGSIVLSTTWGNRHEGHNRTQYHVREQACRAQSYTVEYKEGEQACSEQSHTGRCRSP